MNSTGDNRSGRDLGGLNLDAAQFECVRDALAHYSGVYIDDGRKRLLQQGVAQRLIATQLSLPTYLNMLSGWGSQRELHALAELVLNHETTFFRNTLHMRALSDELLPALHRQKPVGAPLRIWSAGCATGEEAYSLAILALETLGRSLSRPVEIIGTDLSEAALAKAKAGRYRGRALGNVSPAIKQRYFVQHEQDLLVNDAVRSLVRFEQLNLLEPFPAWTAGIDVIFCQNVTIYFQVATCRELMERFYATLPEGGLLFLGFSETIWHIFNRFLTREIGGAFVYYKESSEVNQRANSYERQRVGQTSRVRGQTEPLRKAAIPVPESDRARRPNPPVVPEQVQKEEGALLLRRSRVLLQNGDSERALELLRRLSPDSDNTPEALVLIARAHANRNELDLALAEARRALELHPLSTEAHLLLGLVYSRQGQWRTASDQLERARYLDAAAPLPSFYLAEAYRHDGRLEAAIREYRNAMEKLAAHPPDTLLDGVAVGWIRETCQRYIEQLTVGKQRGV